MVEITLVIFVSHEVVGITHIYHSVSVSFFPFSSFCVTSCLYLERWNSSGPKLFHSKAHVNINVSYLFYDAHVWCVDYKHVMRFYHR